QGVGAMECQLVPVIVGHPVTAWSRDRWAVLISGHAGDSVILLRPRGEAAADAWPARRGDERVAADLASRPELHCRAEASSLLFDAGDLLADDRHVFITRAVLERNRGAGVADA